MAVRMPHGLLVRQAASANPGMVSRTMRVIGAGAGAVVLGTLLLMGVHPQAQEVGEESEVQPVTESELTLYIEVYGAMQADHGLTIDHALAARNVSLDQFRSIERRVQQQQRTVDRVRQALLDQAKARSGSWSPTVVVTPSPAATSGRTHKPARH